jgi:hypothetical protein
MFGIIYLFKRQSAGNFGFSTKATAVAKNTYTNNNNNLPLIYGLKSPSRNLYTSSETYSSLKPISEHVPNHKSKLQDEEFG